MAPGSCESHYNKPDFPITQAGVKLYAQTMPNYKNVVIAHCSHLAR